MMERIRDIDNLDYEIPRILIALVALSQLAFSQTHIETVVLLFVREIGFFLFGFIFAGLISSFFLISMAEIDRAGFFRVLVPLIIAIAFGGYVLYLMLTDTAQIPFSVIQSSVISLIISLVVNVLGTIALGVAMAKRHKKEEVVHN